MKVSRRYLNLFDTAHLISIFYSYGLKLKKVKVRLK